MIANTNFTSVPLVTTAFILFFDIIADKVHLNSYSKTTIYTQNYLLNYFIVFLSCYSFKILPAKPLGCSSFLHVSTGHTYFPNDKIRIAWMPIRPNMLFFAVESLKSQLGKPASKSVDGCYAWFSIGMETHLWGRAYLYVSVIIIGFV